MRLFFALFLIGCAPTAAERAFSLGQLGIAWDPVDEKQRAAAEHELLDGLGREKDPRVRDRMVEALGKVGGEASADTLTRLLSGPERARAAIAIGVLHKNGKLKTAIEVAPLFADRDDEVRYAAAYAQLRMKRSCDAQLHDSSWLVRATCARASSDAAALKDLIDDPDERVAAEAGRSLAKLAVKGQAIEVLAATGAWRPQVAAAISAEPITDARAVSLFASRAGDDCLLALAHDRAEGRIDRLAGCRRALWSRALGEMKGEVLPRVTELATLAQDGDAAVRAAAAESLGKLAGSDEILKTLLGDPDLAVVAAAAEAVASRKNADLPIAERLHGLKGPNAIEAIQALANAAAELGIRAAISPLQALAGDENTAVRLAARQALIKLGATPPGYAEKKFARTPRPDAYVQLLTQRGPILVHLFGAAAPRTVENFLRLVRARFYDGLKFHRVVPGFVAQGGDPRGDGSGGPGWTIPCEINPRRYREGTVGMALSGPDTGGSQFFIALSPQPHLDGRYTVFGEVVEGMAAARVLEEEDRIWSARVLE